MADANQGRVKRVVAELRRRRVFRGLAAYTIAGLMVAEGADIFFPSLGFGIAPVASGFGMAQKCAAGIVDPKA